jgi:hypothetical protein
MQWHPLVHQRWANERLHFWRLGFFPTYRGEEISHKIREAMSVQRVTSGTAYELVGIHDVLLRVWLPSTSSADEFQETLIAHLAQCDLRIAEYFQVHRLVRNWIWGQPYSAAAGPTPGALDERPSDAVIAAAENHEEPYFSNLHGLGLLTDPDYHDDGVKFFIVVTASPATQSLATVRRLEERLAAILDSAPAPIRERSLYAGQGFGQFILMGNVEYSSFYSITEDLSARINDHELQDQFLARTYTHLEGLRKPRIRVDTLPRFEETAVKGAQELLLQDESVTFEVKGSAFFNITRYVETGETSWSDKVPTASAVRSVVSLLNAYGGVLLVGAVERSRFGDTVSFEKLAQLGPIEVVGDYICIGVAADFRDPDEQWDGYQRGIQDIMRSRIRPDPTAYVRIEKDRVGPLDVCTIYVRSPTNPDRDWFYAVEDGQELFYVREGSENKRKPASEVAAYVRGRHG